MIKGCVQSVTVCLCVMMEELKTVSREGEGINLFPVFVL